MDTSKNQFVNSSERKVEFFQDWFDTTWFMVLISDMRPIQISTFNQNYKEQIYGNKKICWITPDCSADCDIEIAPNICNN